MSKSKDIQHTTTTTTVDPKWTQSFMSALGNAVNYGMNNIMPSGVKNYWNNSYTLDGGEWDGIRGQASNILAPVNDVLSRWQSTHGGQYAMPGAPAGQAAASPAFSIAMQVKMAGQQANLYNQLRQERHGQLNQSIPWMLGAAAGGIQTQQKQTITDPNAKNDQWNKGPTTRSANTGGGGGTRPLVYPVTGWGNGGAVGMGFTTSPDPYGQGGGTQMLPSVDATMGSTFGQSNLSSSRNRNQQQQPG